MPTRFSRLTRACFTLSTFLLCLGLWQLPTASAQGPKAKRSTKKTKPATKGKKANKKQAQTAGHKAPPTRRVEVQLIATTPKTKKKKAKKKQGPTKRVIKRWLRLGPAPAPMPVYAKEKSWGFKQHALLKRRHLQLTNLRPQAKQSHGWFPLRQLSWTPGSGKLKPQGKHTQLAYLATYVRTDRYVQLTLRARSHQRLLLSLNGRLIGKKLGCTKRPKRGKHARKHKKKHKAKKTKKAKAPASRPSSQAKAEAKSPQARLLEQMAHLLQGQTRILLEQAKTIRHQNKLLLRQFKKKPKRPKAGMLRATLKLPPGHHILILKTLYDPKCFGGWKVKASLHKTRKSPLPKTLALSLQPQELHSTRFLLNRKRLSGLAISPNGKQILTWMRKTHRNGKSSWWSELRRTKDGSLIRSSRPHYPLYNMRWAPNGKYYSFLSRSRKGSHLWLVERKTGKVRKLLTGVRRLAGHIWAPNSRFIVYTAYDKPKRSKTVKAGLKRLHGMEDRWPWYRKRYYLYALSLSGTSQRLTSGKWSTISPSIRADGKRLLFLRSKPDYNARPFRTVSIHELDLTTFEERTILKGLRWLNRASYSPRGDKLLLLGGPELFGNIGRAPHLPKKQIASAYDTQAYIYDLRRKEVKAISTLFPPAIRRAYWHPLDGKIYISALDRTRMRLFRYSPRTHQYTLIPTQADIASSISFSHNTPRVAYIGSGIQHPGRLYTLDLHNPQPRVLHAPNKTGFGRLHLGAVKPFPFTNAKGRRIEGRVYYPPGFDPRKKYPVIVYYYGGTYPTTRSFDGRYPAHLWAAHGYLVYILQPSGAIGYGQAHASLHVNEWGSRVAQEIIQGTRLFLSQHPSADPKRVGCIGASYGGFMTMYVITRTQMFASAISHAGISNITSYWGGGYWGFLYNSVSAATRYPWSHPSFYINQSPLYAAHKIKTPLLLLHGDSDTNVPPHESYQMYAALRLLKKPVELVLVKKSNHWVIRYKKRLLWTQTILAWFEHTLKGRSLWWKALHGKAKH